MVKPVLLVEDDDDYRAVVAEAIEALGVRTAQAANGLEALRVLERDGATAVITDWHMPSMDGCQLVSIMRADERWTDIPVVFLCGSSPTIEVSGPVTFIEKMDIGRVLSMLQSILPPAAFVQAVPVERSGRHRARTRRIFIGL